MPNSKGRLLKMTIAEIYSVVYHGQTYEFSNEYSRNNWLTVVEANPLFNLPLVLQVLYKLPWACAALASTDKDENDKGTYPNTVQAIGVIDLLACLTTEERIAHAVVELTVRLGITEEQQQKIFDETIDFDEEPVMMIKIFYTRLFCRLKETILDLHFRHVKDYDSCGISGLYALVNFKYHGFFYSYAVTHHADRCVSGVYTLSEVLRKKLEARINEHTALDNPYGLMRDLLGRDALNFYDDA